LSIVYRNEICTLRNKTCHSIVECDVRGFQRP
jgi:hypothetical protein